MKIIDVIGHLSVPVSREENDLLNKADKYILVKEELNERERQLAKGLVTRGVLERMKDNNKTVYKIKSGGYK